MGGCCKQIGGSGNSWEYDVKLKTSPEMVSQLRNFIRYSNNVHGVTKYMVTIQIYGLTENRGITRFARKIYIAIGFRKICVFNFFTN